MFPWLSCCTLAEVAKAAKGLVVTARKFNGNWPISLLSFESPITLFSVFIVATVSEIAGIKLQFCRASPI
jgi:hypothetical protein